MKYTDQEWNDKVSDLAAWSNHKLSHPSYNMPTKLVSNTSTGVAFTLILDELQEMHDRKSKDYGKGLKDPFANVRASEDFGIPGWVGSLVRANDKFRRLQKVAQGGTLANESVEDSLIDAAVYIVIALALFRESNGDSKK